MDAYDESVSRRYGHLRLVRFGAGEGVGTAAVAARIWCIDHRHWTCSRRMDWRRRAGCSRPAFNELDTSGSGDLALWRRGLPAHLSAKSRYAVGPHRRDRQCPEPFGSDAGDVPERSGARRTGAQWPARCFAIPRNTRRASHPVGAAGRELSEGDQRDSSCADRRRDDLDRYRSEAVRTGLEGRSGGVCWHDFPFPDAPERCPGRSAAHAAARATGCGVTIRARAGNKAATGRFVLLPRVLP